MISSWEASGAGGGPLKRDRLWFFVNARKYQTLAPVPGAFPNLNAGDPTKWTYVKNPNVELRSADSRAIESVRLTGQVTPRNRVTFSHEHQHRCSGSSLSPSGDGCRTSESGWVGVGNLTSSPESFPGYHDFPYNVTQATWSAPVTGRLLLEAGYSRFQYLWAGFGQVPRDGITNLIPVTEQSTMYNGQATPNYLRVSDPLGFAYADNDANPNNWRMTASYVTGAHNMKVITRARSKSRCRGVANETQLHYRFNNGRAERRRLILRLAGSRTIGRRSSRGSSRISGRKTGLRSRAACVSTTRASWAPADLNGTSLALALRSGADQLLAHR